MADHPTPETVALYVTDGLDPAAATAVEDHARGCPSCAAALAREARLEQELSEVARVAIDPPRATRQRRWARLAGGAIAGFACAAAVALWIVSRPTAVGAPLPVAVTCIEATDEAGCLSEAARQGWVPQFQPARARFDRTGGDGDGRMDDHGEMR